MRLGRGRPGRGGPLLLTAPSCLDELAERAVLRAMEDLSAGRTDPDREGGRRIRVVLRADGPAVLPWIREGSWVLHDPGGGVLALRWSDGSNLLDAVPARGGALAREAAAALVLEARALMAAACVRMRGLGLDEEGIVLEALRTLAEEVHSS